MKKIFIILVSACLALLSCSKASLPGVTLSSDLYEVSVEKYSNTIAFTLSWEKSGGNVDISKTYVQFCTDKEFVSPYVLSSSEDSFVVTFKDLKKIQDNFGTVEDYELIIRLLVEGEEVPSVYSNKIRIKVHLPS